MIRRQVVRGAATFFLAAAATCSGIASSDDPSAAVDPLDVPAPPFESVPPVYGLRQIARDARYLARRPFRLDPPGRRRLAAVTGTTFGLYLVRDEVREWAQDHQRDSRSRFLDDVRTMGKGGVAPALALAAYASSLFTGRDKEKETAFLLLESMAFSATAAFAGQHVLATDRPKDGDRIRLFEANGHGVSLDAALAASIVPPLRRQYLRVRPGDSRQRRFWKRAGTVLLYGAAALTAYQRVDRDKHWAPEAFLGTVLGLAIGENLGRSHDEAARRLRRAGARAPADPS